MLSAFTCCCPGFIGICFEWVDVKHMIILGGNCKQAIVLGFYFLLWEWITCLQCYVETLFFVTWTPPPDIFLWGQSPRNALVILAAFQPPRHKGVHEAFLGYRLQSSVPKRGHEHFQNCYLCFLFFHYHLLIFLELRVGELVILLFTSEQLVKTKATSRSGINHIISSYVYTSVNMLLAACLPLMCLALQSAGWERLVFASNCLAPTSQGQAPAGSCSSLLSVLWNMRASHTY